MITLSVLMLVALLWLAASLVGLVFKLFFGLVAAVFHLIGGVLGLVFGGVALLVAAPIVMLALLPLWLPVLLVVAVIWGIVKMFDRTPPAQIQTTR